MNTTVESQTPGDGGLAHISAHLIPNVGQQQQSTNVNLFSLSDFMSNLVDEMNIMDQTLSARKIETGNIRMICFETVTRAQVSMYMHNMDAKYSDMVYDFILSNLNYIFLTAHDRGAGAPQHMISYIKTSFSDVLSAAGVTVSVS